MKLALYRIFLLIEIGDSNFGGKDHACNRPCILEANSHYLGRVDDPLLHEVFVGAGLCVMPNPFSSCPLIVAMTSCTLNAGILFAISSMALLMHIQ